MNATIQIIADKESQSGDDLPRETSPMPKAFDPNAEKAKQIVTDFVHLLEKSKNLFNGLK